MHGSVADAAAGGAASQAAQAAALFRRDATHTLRWHAVAAGVALAATPVVYQVARVVARSHRADLVHLAKDAVQREELFNGAEADGVLIDPADEGGISVSYTSTSSRAATPGDGGCDSNTAASPSADAQSPSQQQQHSDTPTSSPFAFRVGRHHSWTISSFAHQVLAAQRAPNVQFVRTCSWAAARQYTIVVLRTTAVSCALSLASLGLLYLGCRAFDHVVRFGEATSPAAPASLLRSLVTAPLFAAAGPPEPAVGCTYGLFDFSVSAAGVWSRLLPRCGALQTAWQQLTGRLQPLHAEWRGGRGPPSSSSASPHARADAVWAALSPRGFFVVALLPRLPARLSALLHWLLRRGTTAALRRWYAAPPSTPPPTTTTTTTASAALTSPSPGGRGTQPTSSVSPSPPSPPHPQQQHASPTAWARQPHGQELLRRRRAPRRLISSPLVRAAAMVASDVAFAGIVFAATSYAPSGPRGGGGDASPRWPFVLNDANDRYDFFCWAEAVCSVLSFVSL